MVLKTIIYIQAFPALVKYSFKAFLSVISAFIDSQKPFPWINPSKTWKNHSTIPGRLLNRRQLKEMNQKGITIFIRSPELYGLYAG